MTWSTLALISMSDSEAIAMTIATLLFASFTVFNIFSYKESYGIKATRIAYGVPVGGELEYVDSNTLTRAIMNRSILE